MIVVCCARDLGALTEVGGAVVNDGTDSLDIFGWCQCIFNRPSRFSAHIFLKKSSYARLIYLF